MCITNLSSTVNRDIERENILSTCFKMIVIFILSICHYICHKVIVRSAHEHQCGINIEAM